MSEIDPKQKQDPIVQRESERPSLLDLRIDSPGLAMDRSAILENQWRLGDRPLTVSQPPNELAVREWLSTLTVEDKEVLLAMVVAGEGCPQENSFPNTSATTSGVTLQTPSFTWHQPQASIGLESLLPVPPQANQAILLDRLSIRGSNTDPIMSPFISRQPTFNINFLGRESEDSRYSSLMLELGQLQKDLPPLHLPLDKIPAWNEAQARLNGARIEMRLGRLEMMMQIAEECKAQHKEPKTLLGQILKGSATCFDAVGINTGYTEMLQRKTDALNLVIESEFPKIEARIREGERLEIIMDDFPQIRDGLAHHGFRFTDPSSKEDAFNELYTLATFYRDANNYSQAGDSLLHVLREPFEAQLGKISPERREELRLQVTAETELWAATHHATWLNPDAQARAKGASEMSEEQIQLLKEAMIEENLERALRKELAVIFDPSGLSGAQAKAWEMYNDIFDPKGEFFNLSDESWDRIAKEVAINAPLILVSGGTAALARGVVTAGCRAVMTRVASSAASRAVAGCLARNSVVRVGMWAARPLCHLTGRGAGLLIEGAVFETTHEALHGRNLWTHEYQDAGRWERVISSSIMLGMFKGGAAVGERVFSRAVAGSSARELTMLGRYVEKIAHPTLQEITKQLLVKGHSQALALVLHSAATEGLLGGGFSREDYWNEVGDSLLSFYIQAGALHLGHASARVVTERSKRLDRIGKDLTVGELDPGVIRLVEQRAEQRRKVLESEDSLPKAEVAELKDKVRELDREIARSNREAAEKGAEHLRVELAAERAATYKSIIDGMKKVWEQISHPVEGIRNASAQARRGIIELVSNCRNAMNHLAKTTCENFVRSVHSIIPGAKQIFQSAVRMPVELLQSSIKLGRSCVSITARAVTLPLEVAWHTAKLGIDAVALPFQTIAAGWKFGNTLLHETRLSWLSRGTGGSMEARSLAESYLRTQKKLKAESNPTERAKLHEALEGSLSSLREMRLSFRIQVESSRLLERAAASLNVPDQAIVIREALGRRATTGATPVDSDERTTGEPNRRDCEKEASPELGSGPSLQLSPRPSRLDGVLSSLDRAIAEKERSRHEEWAKQADAEFKATVDQISKEVATGGGTPSWPAPTRMARVRALFLTIATLFPSGASAEVSRTSTRVAATTIELVESSKGESLRGSRNSEQLQGTTTLGADARPSAERSGRETWQSEEATKVLDQKIPSKPIEAASTSRIHAEISSKSDRAAKTETSKSLSVGLQATDSENEQLSPKDEESRDQSVQDLEDNTNDATVDYTLDIISESVQQLVQETAQQQVVQSEFRREAREKLREEEQRKRYRTRLRWPHHSSSSDPEIPEHEDKHIGRSRESSRSDFVSERSKIAYHSGRRVWVEVSLHSHSEERLVNRGKANKTSRPDPRNNRDLAQDGEPSEYDRIMDSLILGSTEWKLDKEYLDSAFETPRTGIS